MCAHVLAGVLLALAVAPAAFGAPVVASYAVVGDAIPEHLDGRRGDAARGRAIAADRATGLCVLCHAGPYADARFAGTVGPDLAGVGARLSEGQLRLRVVDSRRLHPDSAMPSFHHTAGLERVGAAWRDRPVLDAQQVEDVVAYLVTLRDGR